jgi:hypothetical protein
MRALMPPWYGTEEENEALTAYLMSLKPAGDHRPPPAMDPAKAFAVSCGLCHTPDRYRGLAESMADLTEPEIEEMLAEIGDWMDEMPGYYGTDDQRALLVRYLHELGNPEAAADQAERSTS